MSCSTKTISLPHFEPLTLLKVFGLVNFIILVSERCCFASCGTPCCGGTRFAFSIIAFVASLAGTIIGAVGPVSIDLFSIFGASLGSLSKLVSTTSPGITFAWGPGFACAIVACLLQAGALALTSISFCTKPTPKQQVVMNQNNHASGYGQTTQSPLSRV